ncbi:MAG TPA: hypothetical protein VJO13_21595, partial [Ktedonobacterales bacterium]|nr:hypothetical protein [Ktedonobacterales bacterium]
MNAGTNYGTNQPWPTSDGRGMYTMAGVIQQTAQQRFIASEQQRRGRLVRIVSLGLLIAMGLLIPTSLIPTPDIVTLITVLVVFLGAGVGYLLNRMRLVNAAGYVVLVGGMLALGWEIVAQSLRQG